MHVTAPVARHGARSTRSRTAPIPEARPGRSAGEAVGPTGVGGDADTPPSVADGGRSRNQPGKGRPAVRAPRRPPGQTTCQATKPVPDLGRLSAETCSLAPGDEIGTRAPEGKLGNSRPWERGELLSERRGRQAPAEARDQGRG